MRTSDVYYKDIPALLAGLRTVHPLSEQFHMHRFEATPATWLEETALFRSDTYSIILLEKGEAEYKIGLSDYHIRSGSLYCMAPKHLRYYKRLSKWEGYVVVFVEAFLETHPILQQLVHELEGFQLGTRPVLGLKEDQLAIAQEQLAQLHTIAYTATPLRFAKIRAALELLLLQLTEWFRQAPTRAESRSPQERLAAAFEQVVEDYLYQLTHHQSAERLTIRAIARQLHVHPSYLGEVIKAVTQQSPKQLLSQRLILEAKALLHNTSLSVAQIGDLLHLSDPSNFSKFFKAHTGFTPKKYRQNQQNKQ